MNSIQAVFMIYSVIRTAWNIFIVAWIDAISRQKVQQALTIPFLCYAAFQFDIAINLKTVLGLLPFLKWCWSIDNQNSSELFENASQKILFLHLIFSGFVRKLISEKQHGRSSKYYIVL